MRISTTRTLFLVALLFVALPTIAQERALSWDALTVHVRIDAQGVLHVTERQAMVFDGDWNGGERVFQLRSWHSLALQSFAEIDPQTQASTSWRENSDLAEVGEYWLNDTVLRWRARMPSDPPFMNTRKTYEVSYSIAGALVPQDGKYILEHDLAFPDRSGPIRTFDATLELDPVWAAEEGAQTRWHEEDLNPGESVFARATLTYTGAGLPQAALSEGAIPSATAEPMLRYGLLGIVIAFVILQVVALLRREKNHGRFEPPMPLEQIDEQWLRANVFVHAPEVVGAAWDFDTSASEVSAMLARLAQQGALKTEVRSTGSGWLKRDVMYLELLWDHNRFAAHERALIDKLFFSGSRMTDTEKIRQYYKSTGFAPAEYIKQGIEMQLPLIFANKLAVPRWVRWLTAALLVAGVVTLFVAVYRAAGDIEPAMLGTTAVLLGCYVVTLVFAYFYRINVYELRGRMLRTMIGIGALYAVLAFVLLAGVVELTSLGLVSLTLLALGFMNSIFNMMRIRERVESLELRRKLASARAFFEQELKSEQPRLEDAWFPYLIAFGLGPRMDKWFKTIAPRSSRTIVHSGSPIGGSSGSSRSSATASAPTWTGGGGAFGGAGASGAWSAAVGSIAAGVSKPSSSSSGRSSGGGSSSSSGGGGGGGW